MGFQYCQPADFFFPWLNFSLKVISVSLGDIFRITRGGESPKWLKWKRMRHRTTKQETILYTWFRGYRIQRMVSEKFYSNRLVTGPIGYRMNCSNSQQFRYQVLLAKRSSVRGWHWRRNHFNTVTLWQRFEKTEFEYDVAINACFLKALPSILSFLCIHPSM